MFQGVDTRDPIAVLHTCQETWRTITGSARDGFISRGFGWVQEAFAGQNPLYEALDTQYHDLEHTLQGTLCLARLLLGWHHAQGQPPLDPRAVRLGILAILLHDTGYLKPRGDHTGTGAKFTPIHVQRSAEVAAAFLAEDGASTDDIREVQAMIRCTGVNADVRRLHFERAVDRRVGGALATADLLGQMAAGDYVDKLPALYREFAEAAAASLDPSASNLGFFRDADDLIRKTPAFWNLHVRPRLDHEFEGAYRYLNDPWPDGPNEYLMRVEANLARIAGTTPLHS